MSSRLCPIPWISTAIRNNGHYRVCCHANNSEDQGLFWDHERRPILASEHKISSTRNHPLLKHIRKEMLEGKWPSSCQRCQNEEGCGIQSRRQYEWDTWKNEISPEKIREKTAADGSIDEAEFPMLSLDLRLGNFCNLKCRMCSPMDSHSWYKEFSLLHSIEVFTDTHGEVHLNPTKRERSSNAYKWYENEEFWKDLEKLSSKIKYIYLIGGEPLLIKRHFEYLKELIAGGLAPNIEIEYNTNLTYLPASVLELWRNFKKITIGLSVDGVGPVNDYIRYPSVFSRVEENIRHLDESGLSNLSVRISMTVQNYNIFGLRDMIEWLADSDFNFIRKEPNSPIIRPHVLYQPTQLNIQILPATIKRKATAAIESLIKDLESPEYLPKKFSASSRKKTVGRFMGIINHMNSNDRSADYEEFLNYTRELDLLRKQSFARIVPEFF